MSSKGSPSLKSCLRAARDAIAGKDYKEALRWAKEALKHDKRSYEAFVFLGKAAFLSGEASQAEQAYRRAIDINAEGLPAWQGLAETSEQGETPADKEKLAEAFQRIAGACEAAGQTEKALDYSRRAATAFAGANKTSNARRIWQSLTMDSRVPAERQLEAQCALAGLEADDFKAAVAEEARRQISAQKKALKAAQKEGEANKQTLSQAVDSEAIQTEVFDEWAASRGSGLVQALENVLPKVLPTGTSARFFTLLLDLCIGNLRYVRCRGAEAEPALNKALRWSLWSVQQGPDSPDWLETVLHLCEEDSSRSLPAWQVYPDLENLNWKSRLAYFGRRLLHAFPSRGLGWIGLAASLQDILGISARERVMALCQRGLALESRSPTGWQLLAQAQLEQGQPAEAANAVLQGLKAVEQLRTSLGLSLRRAEFELRVVHGYCLLQLGSYAEALATFTGVEQEATASSTLHVEEKKALQSTGLVGQAKVHLATGKGVEAREALQTVLSFDPNSGWGHGELGWLAYTTAKAQADLFSAQTSLETAVALEPGQALHHLRLGGVMWAQGGDQQHASSSRFLEAARLDPQNGAAFGALGRHYALLGGDQSRAKRCLQRAVTLDPTDAASGELLADLMAAAGQASLEAALCKDAASRSPRAFWAWRRQGMLELQSEQWSAAVISLQHAVRGEVENIDAWEALGYAYERLGRFTAALKAFGRVQMLCLRKGQKRPFSLIQAAGIQLNLGKPEEAIAGFRAALALLPNHPAALAGLAGALLARARGWLHEGSPSAAVDLLKEAAQHAKQVADGQGGLVTAWKLSGDIYYLFSTTAPAGTPAQVDSDLSLAKLRQQKLQWALQSQRAFCRAVHLKPSAACGLADLAVALSSRAELLQPMVEGKPTRQWGWQVAVSQAETELAGELRESAVRTAVGAVHLDPSNPTLWTILGAVTRDTGWQQHAYIRALQIDHNVATAWVNLGQMYVRAGAFELAALAFDQARSADPGLAIPWVGMAFMRIRTSAEEPFVREALQDCLQGLQLQPVAEAQLGVGLLAARLGKLADPQVHLALRQCASQLPSVPAAHNLLGLSCEALGMAGAAVRCFATARKVLQSQDSAVAEAISLNLSRALAKTGQAEQATQECAEAIAKGYADFKDDFTPLQQAGVACFWRAYALAAASIDQFDLAQSALQTVLQEVVPVSLDQPLPQHGASLRLQWQLTAKAEGVQKALQGAQESPWEFWQDPRVAIVGLVLAALAKDNSAIPGIMAHCRLLFSHDFAPTTYRVLSNAQRLQGSEEAAVRRLKGAVHIFPSDASLRAALGAAVLRTDPLEAVVACRACGLQNVPTPYLEVAARCFLAFGASALPNGCKPHQALASVQRWCRESPNCPSARAALAFTTAAAARHEGHPSHRCLSAARLCQAACALVPKGASVLERARLQAVRSDMLLHVQGPGGGAEEAGIVADIALKQHAHEAHSGQGEAYHRLARCQLAAGEVALGDADYERGASWGSLACAVELAALRLRGPFPATQALDLAESLAVKVKPESCRAAWQAVILCLRAAALLGKGDLQAAATCAAEAAGQCPNNHALHLLQGALLLEVAASGASPEANGAARKCLGRAAYLTRNSASPLVHYLLAQAEVAAAGSARRGREKWEAYMLQEIKCWAPERWPAELVYQMAHLAEGGEKQEGASEDDVHSIVKRRSAKTWVLHAVHMHPSCRMYCLSTHVRPVH